MRILAFLMASLAGALPALGQTRYVSYYDSIPALTNAVVSTTTDIGRVAVVKYATTLGALDSGAVFYYSPGSAAAVDGSTVLAPASGVGRWLRGNAPSAGGGAGEVLFTDFNTNYFTTNVASGGKIGVQTGETTPHWNNVKDPDFGASGNDSANDTAAIQAAINALSSTNGGTVYLPRGTYLTDALTVTNNRIEIRGDGYETTLKRRVAGTSDLLLVTGQEFQLRNMRLLAALTLTTNVNSSLCLSNVSDSTVENVWFFGDWDQAKVFYGNNHRFKNCIFEASQHHGMRIYQSFLDLIEGNAYYNIGNGVDDGATNNTAGIFIAMDPAYSFAPYGTTIQGNVFRKGLLAHGIKATNAVGLSIVGNVFNLSGTFNPGTKDDINLGGVTNAVVSGNSSIASFNDYIPGNRASRYVVNLSANSRGIRIGQNYFEAGLSGTINDLATRTEYFADTGHLLQTNLTVNASVLATNSLNFGPSVNNAFYEGAGEAIAQVNLKPFQFYDAGRGNTTFRLNTNRSANFYGAVTIASNLTVNPATSAEGSVFSVSGGVGQFVSAIGNASITDVAWPKVTAGENSAALTNNNTINKKSMHDIVAWNGNNVSQTVDMAANPTVWTALTNNTTWTFANVPTSTNLSSGITLQIYNPSTYTGTFSYTGLVWVSKITPTITTNGWTKLFFDWNGTNVLGTVVDAGATNALDQLYGGSGLSTTADGDLFTGKTSGSSWNRVTHPGSNGKMPYSTNVAPWVTWGDAPAGSSAFDVTDQTKYYWRETFTPLVVDGARRYGDSPWVHYKITSGGVDRLSAEIAARGAWRFFPDASQTDALFLQAGNDDSGALDNKPFMLGTNSPALTVKMRLRFSNQINGTDDIQFRFGLTDQQAGLTNRATNCIIFQIDRLADTTQWGCTTSTNSTATVSDSNTNFGTNWVRLAMEISQHATNVVFKIDGTSVATNTTNIPWSKQLGFGFAGHWVAGAQTIAYLDDVIIYEP